MNRQLLGIVRRSRAEALRRLDVLGRHPSGITGASTARIDDPDGHSAIFVVRGVLDAHSLSDLWDDVEQLATTTTVHLDLTDASILPGPWLTEVEVLADALEAAGCDVQVVGVNPHHPDLWHRPGCDPRT